MTRAGGSLRARLCFEDAICPARQLRRRLSTTSKLAEQVAKQPQTEAAEHIELSAPAIYISESHDPWFNLSYEDWLLRNSPRDQPVLFLCRNFPCVVIGRNQNPWKETTPRKLREWNIPLVRRRSGGGTVYHDMGNTNFSIILPRLLFTRAHGAQLAATAVREGMGVKECTVNDRNDVIIRDTSQQPAMDLKVSGSAYKIIQHRAYHHGTMLISSNVKDLGKALKSDSPGIDTKGVPSFRSPVTTLSQYRPPTQSSLPYTHNDFIRAITSEFTKIYSSPSKPIQTLEITEGSIKEKKVLEGIKELKSWEWTYGQSPEFSNRFEGDLSVGNIAVSLTCRHALITSMTIHLTPAPTISDPQATEIQDLLDSLSLSLIGRRYESLEGADGAEGPWTNNSQWNELSKEILQWMRKTM